MLGPISPSAVEDTNGRCAYPFSDFPGILQRGMADRWLRKGPKVITRSFVAPKSGPADRDRACRASSGRRWMSCGSQRGSHCPHLHTDQSLLTPGCCHCWGTPPVGIQCAQAAPANTSRVLLNLSPWLHHCCAMQKNQVTTTSSC